jgi:protein ImuA
LRAWEAPASLAGEVRLVPFGVAAIDAGLGGGLACGTLHEVAAPNEPDLAAATGFALALAAGACAVAGKSILWAAEDMSRLENGAPYGPGLDAFGLAPERLLSVVATKSREVLWAMEEALRCHAIGAVIGEVRGDGIDLVATRRLSLAAAEGGALALLLRTLPPQQASAAATRWVVGSAPSRTAHEPRLLGTGSPRFAVELVRNRRGPLGTWMLEFGRDQRFLLASADPEPVAPPARDRSPRAASAA